MRGSEIDPIEDITHHGGGSKIDHTKDRTNSDPKRNIDVLNVI